MLDAEKEKVCWLWLQQALGAGSAKPDRIAERFGTASAFYEAGPTEWRLTGWFTPKEAIRLEQETPEKALAMLEYCRSVGQTVLTPCDAAYPEALRQIPAKPCALYIKGDLPDVDRQLAIAVVGTRHATRDGLEISFNFGYQLAGSGAIIVSGGAKGIDTQAHKGAVQAGGKTICVLGCGIDYAYLMENASLREAIAQAGAVISEYPVNTPPSKGNFPIRNRLISGLCAGVLVVEAAAKSGSLITAHTALEQNRDVFAVPCGLNNPVSQGVNNLIKCGAKAVTGVQDILEEYAARFPEVSARLGCASATPVPVHEPSARPVPRQASPAVPAASASPLSEEARRVWECLPATPCTLGEIEEETGLPVARLLAALTELELHGQVSSYSGRRYGRA